MPTMRLSAWQIAKHFDLHQQPLDPVEIEAMYKVWAEFFTLILGPQQAWEDTIHPEGCTMSTCKHEWDKRCKTRAEEMWQWDSFSLVNYKPPQVQARGLDSILSAVLIYLLPFMAAR